MQTGVAGKGAGWLVQTVTLQSGVVYHWKNQVQIETQAQPWNTANGQVRLGAEQNLGSKVAMQVAEIAVYNRALTSNERTTVVAYLMSKYNLA